MRFFSIVILTLIFTLILCNCSGNKKLSKEKTFPYNVAIEAFLNKKSMDMKVVEFLSMDETGDISSCVVKMQDANGLYSIKPKWEFKLAKENDNWVVKSYKIL